MLIKSTTLLCFLPVLIFGQLPQSGPKIFIPKLDLPVIIAGGAFFAVGKIRQQTVSPFSLAQLNALPIPAKLDYAERHYSKSARVWSDGLVYSSYATAAFVCATQKNNRTQLFQNTLQLAEVGLLVAGATVFTKTHALRPRPYIYNDRAPIAEKLKKEARYSFFSGHTSSAAACSFYAATVWAQHHADSAQKKWVWTAALIYPAAVGFLRMQGGMHHFEDVAVGYAVGALIGWGVPKLQQIARR